MPIKNYTTKIDVFESLGEIQGAEGRCIRFTKADRFCSAAGRSDRHEREARTAYSGAASGNARSSEIVGAAVTVLDHGVECCGVLDNDIHEGICVATGASGNYLKEKDYGKTWVAFPHSDSHKTSETELSAEWKNSADEYPECTNCGYMPVYDPAIDDIWYSPFCPQCGAKMKNGEALE